MHISAASSASFTPIDDGFGFDGPQDLGSTPRVAGDGVDTMPDWNPDMFALAARSDGAKAPTSPSLDQLCPPGQTLTTIPIDEDNSLLVCKAKGGKPKPPPATAPKPEPSPTPAPTPTPPTPTPPSTGPSGAPILD
jgi:hypothetical protein